VADRETTHTVEVTNRRGLGRARQASIGRDYTEVFLAFEGSLSGQDLHDHARFDRDGQTGSRDGKALGDLSVVPVTRTGAFT